jgi:hypothetical protein
MAVLVIIVVILRELAYSSFLLGEITMDEFSSLGYMATKYLSSKKFQ